MFTRIKERTTTEDTFEIPILPPWLKIQKYQISFFKKFFCIEQSIYKGFGYPGKFSYIYTHIKHIMEDFSLRGYLKENRLVSEDDNFEKNERLIQFIKDISSLRSKYIDDIVDNKEILDGLDTLNKLIQKEIK